MVLVLALLFFQQPQELELPATNPHTTLADVEQGRRLYGGRCAGCHGPTGDGGKGANLAVPVLPRAETDRALYLVIRYGIVDTEMPSTLLAPREVWQVAAFVRSLGRLPFEASAGDASRGERVVRGKGGCLQCHALGTDGGRMGPALSAIGARRSPGFLRSKLLDASRDIPELFRLVEISTRDGRKISGVRLNEDTHSVQVRDFSSTLHSFWKTDLAAYKAERRTPMPSYRDRLSNAELNDVVAYLTSLRGGQ